MTPPPPGRRAKYPGKTAQSPKNHNSKVRSRTPAGWQSAGGLCAVSGRKKRRAFSAAGPAFCLLPLLKTIQFPSKFTYSLPRLPAQVVISRAQSWIRRPLRAIPAFHRRCDGAVGDGVPACRVPRHAAKRATLRLADASSARFPLWNPLRQNLRQIAHSEHSSCAHNCRKISLSVSPSSAHVRRRRRILTFSTICGTVGDGVRLDAAVPLPGAGVGHPVHDHSRPHGPAGQHRGRGREQAGLPAEAAPGQARSAATLLS